LGDNHPEYGTTLNNLAALYKNTGHFEQSEPLYLESADIRKGTLGEKHQEYAASLNNLASLYESMGRNNEAEPLYLQSLKILKELFGVKNPYYAQALNNLAGLYKSLKRFDESQKLYKESLGITAQVLGDKHPTYAITLNNLANLQMQKGDHKQSEKLFLENIQKTKEALGTKHPNYAVSLGNLAGLYEHMGKYEQAEKLYVEALQIRKEALGIKHPSYTSTLSSLARLYTALKKYEIADTIWEKALGNHLYEIQTFFPSMSEKEKGQFYQTISEEFEIFNSYAFLRASSNPKVLSQMYNNQLATKALLLNSSNKLRQRILGSKDTSLIKMYKHWLSEKEFLSKIYALPKEEVKKQQINVDSIEKVANDLEKKLSLKSELFKNTNEIPFYTWKDVQKNLNSGEGALEIIRFTKYKFDSAGVYTDSIYYAGLIVKENTSGNPEIVWMIDGNKMEGKNLSIYKNSIRYRIEDKESYNLYWKNIQDKLSETKRIYLSPDAVFNQINVNALQNPLTQKYAFDEIDIRLVTNTKDLINRKNLSNTKKQIVLFGDPNYVSEGAAASAPKISSEAVPEEDKYGYYLNPLPGTAKEVTSINESMSTHRWQSKLYTGENATEKNLKLINSPKVIHIATHGFFEKSNKNKEKKISENPLLASGVMLAGASVTLYNKDHNVFNSEKIETKQEDGILTAYEAMNLNLDYTDLVVLSACETGLGQIKNGEGVYGLQRAFIIAGAKSIIISLWKVNDETTQKLMTYFYQEWVKTDNKNTAFKKAQLRLKQEFPQPYYWGAFIMVQ
jgi:CHAT domain-containing protein